MDLQEVLDYSPGLPAELIRLMSILDAVYEGLTWYVTEHGNNHYHAYAKYNLTEISFDYYG